MARTVMTAEERLARMEALCRRIADAVPRTMHLSLENTYKIAGCDLVEAKTIVASLPDPDVLVVRSILAAYYDASPSVRYAAKDCESGAYDDTHAMQAALAVYKAGKAARDE